MSYESYEIRVDELSLRRAMDRLNPTALFKRVHAGMDESLALILSMVQRETPVDRGILRGAEFSELRGTTLSSLRGVVGVGASAKEYGEIVERGRRPGGRMPPVEAIAAWLHRKGSTASAFVVARSIARRGTTGQFMFKKAYERARGIVPGIILRHLDRP